MKSHLLPAIAAAALACGHSGEDRGPPSYRTLTATRVASGEASLSAHVKFAAGKFRVLSGSEDQLYALTVVFDENRFDPSTDYDAESRHLYVEVRPGRMGGRWRLEEQRLELALNPAIPTELHLELGAVETALDLGNMALSDVTIATGASATTIAYGGPNRVPCGRFKLQVGAAELQATGLANARCARYDVEGGVGSLTLDFDGAWQADAAARLDLKLGIGSVRVRLPRAVGATIRMSKVLVDFSAPGFTRQGSTYVSDNFDTAGPKLDIRVDAAFGEVKVEWLDDSEG